MQSTSLRRKILVYSSSLLVALIVTMLVYVNFQAEAFVDERLEGDLQRGRELVAGAERQRLDSMGLTAGLVASFPSLKAALTSEALTVRDFLQSYQRENSDQLDLLIAFDGEGRVLARTDQADPGDIPLPPETGVLTLESGNYHVATMPAEAAGFVFGYVLAGIRIDDTFARDLNEISSDDIVIVSDRVIGSSILQSNLPWKTRAEWDAVIESNVSQKAVTIGGETYEAVAMLFGGAGGPRPLAVIMQSHDRAMLPYRRIQIGLLVLGIIAATGGVTGSAVLARNLTAPVAKLVEGTRQVAAGNFEYRLDVRTSDEIGVLAGSFNTMIQGLRERSDMQKFVSQSTVDMIQANAQKKISAGEKLILTIFFSDMRGFTAMTENMSPEETVTLLNSCLSLQAKRVKKFGGDVDKFVGDCVVALFDGNDMALNAIRCAVEIHKALGALNASRPGEAAVRVGVGIVTGEVILGSIGSDDRLDFTAIGSNVNLCSRLCSQARAGETLLSESAYELVAGLVAAQKIEPLTVKGFSEPVSVYRMG